MAWENLRAVRRVGALLVLSVVACSGRSRSVADREGRHGSGGGASGSSSGTAGSGGAISTGGSSTGGSIAKGGSAGTIVDPNGGVAGETGEAGAGGEGGTVEPCEPMSVRCVVRRQWCTPEGVWAEDDFVCATALDGSREMPIACAVKATGEMACWGYASVLEQTRQMLAPGPWTDVAVADEPNYRYPQGVCGLDAERNATCWGEGQVARRGGPYRVIAPSQFGTCAVSEAGSIVCFDGTDLVDTALDDPGPFQDVELNNTLVFALRRDGRFIAPYESLSLPDGVYTDISANSTGVCGVREDGVVACVPEIPLPSELETARFTQVELVWGSSQVCAIRREGSLACWGDGAPEPPEGTFTRITSASTSMCGIRTDGSITCFGGTSPLVPPDGW